MSVAACLHGNYKLTNVAAGVTWLPMRYWLQQDWKRTEGAGREGFHGDRLLHCVAATNKSPEFVMDQTEQPNAQPLCSSSGGF